MTHTYTIKPLKWNIGGWRKFEQTAETPFCSYSVYGVGERWEVYYYFDEHYDEGIFDLTYPTIDQAKKEAEAHWRERLSGALEKCGEAT